MPLPFVLPLSHTTAACPVCRAAEVACYGPRSLYACGASTYDGLVATLLPGSAPSHRLHAYVLRFVFGLLLHLQWTRLLIHRREQWDLSDAGLTTFLVVHLRTIGRSSRLFALTNRGFRR